jgi:cytochrome P450
MDQKCYGVFHSVNYSQPSHHDVIIFFVYLRIFQYDRVVINQAHGLNFLFTRKVIPEDHIVLDGRRASAGTTVQFPLERLARDKAAWADPDEFRPERFLAGGEGEGVSLVAAAGSAGEIKMMPFGAGRRMCPGMGVAMLHLGYFVANLVREFEWTEAGGDMAVDLEPQVRFLNVMKQPLRAHLAMRRKTR